jgi:PleD family two-component response regulator
VFQRRTTDPAHLFCPCFGRCDILVVDDNVFNIMTLQTMLEVSLKLKSDRALNGKEAVDLVRKRMREDSDEPCHCKKNR